MPKKIKTNKRQLRSRALAAGYRSGLEQDLIDQTKTEGIEARYEPFKMPFIQPEKKRHYTVDFDLGNGVLIESKGRFTVEDRKKHLLIKAQYPDLDIRFVFSRSKSPISKGSKTTYGMWCEKHGFQYADKLIPTDWLHERPNKLSLKQIKSFE